MIHKVINKERGPEFNAFYHISTANPTVPPEAVREGRSKRSLPGLKISPVRAQQYTQPQGIKQNLERSMGYYQPLKKAPYKF